MASSSGKHSAKHRRQSLKRRHTGSSSDSGAHRQSSSSVAPTESFAPPPRASRKEIRMPEPMGPPPAFRFFVLGFSAVVLLVLLGGGHNALALGTALLMPGLGLVIKPPTRGLGKFGDFGFIGLLLCLLLAFVPQFYWATADWRVDAVEVFGVELPSVLSVQPWISFEAWLLVLAGFAWLYTVLQWPVNLAGRRWLYFWLSIMLSGLAVIVIWGNLMGAHYPGAGEATAFSFFKNQNLTANFFAVGGVATFIYVLEGLRSRSLVPLIGLPATALCFIALATGGSCEGILVYFFGIGLWFMLSLRSRAIPRGFKFGFSLVVIVFCFALGNSDRSVQRIGRFIASDSHLNDQLRAKVYEDAADMVLAAPISGFGLGSFSAVFPQYRAASASDQTVAQPRSDVLWLASEGGLLALGFLLIFLWGYGLSCRGMREGMSASYRLLALVVVIIFIVNGLFDVVGHSPGNVYFAILFAVLALPSHDQKDTYLPKLFWRGAGSLLILFGLIWVLAGLFNAPWHSSVRLARDQAALEAHIADGNTEEAKSVIAKWLSLRPLDWRAYFERAQLTLLETGDVESAVADFDRARDVEPILGIVSYEEGQVWLPYDLDRVVAAWRETLLREMKDKDSAYMRMLQLASESSGLQSRMARLSEVSPYYRAFFLRSLEGEELDEEMAYELSKDATLSGFSVALRTGIVENWIKHGDLAMAEKFLLAHEESLSDSWWLWSLLLKDQAKFEQAIDRIRKHVETPKIPASKLEESVFERLVREYAVDSSNVMKGNTLISIYLNNQDYEKALSVLDRLLEIPEPPLYLYYWRAECLYQLQDYIESWYSFQSYLTKLWGKTGAKSQANPVARGS